MQGGERGRDRGRSAPTYPLSSDLQHHHHRYRGRGRSSRVRIHGDVGLR